MRRKPKPGCATGDQQRGELESDSTGRRKLVCHEIRFRILASADHVWPAAGAKRENAPHPKRQTGCGVFVRKTSPFQPFSVEQLERELQLARAEILVADKRKP